MASKSVTYSVTEVTVVSGKTSKIKVKIDGKDVAITVPSDVKAHFDEQFSRPNPTHQQKKKYATLMSLMRAAYLQGQEDAEK